MGETKEGAKGHKFVSFLCPIPIEGPPTFPLFDASETLFPLHFSAMLRFQFADSRSNITPPELLVLTV
jgi:hypothetical protein